MQTFPSSLLNGYRNFMDGRYVDERERYRRLAENGVILEYGTKRFTTLHELLPATPVT